MVSRIILSAMLVVLALVPARPAAAYWGTYQHDARNTSMADAAGPSDFKVKWSVQHVESEGGSAFEAGVVVGPDGTIFTADWDNQGFAIDPADGRIIYTFNDIGACCAPPAVGADGTVYFLGNGITAWDPVYGTDGKPASYTLKWRYTDAGGCCSGISIGTDGTIYTGDGWTTALDPNPTEFIDPVEKTVNFKWRAEFGGRFAASDNTTVYVTDTYTLYALNTDPTGTLGALKWSLPICNDLGPEAIPVIGKYGKIYSADCEKLIEIDPSLITDPSSTILPAEAIRTVMEIPGKQIGFMAFDGTSFGDNDGAIVAVTHGFTVDPDTQEKTWNINGEINSYDVGSGEMWWTVPLSGSDGLTWVAKPVIDANGAVYIASKDFIDDVDVSVHLYAIDAWGTVMWQYDKSTTYRSDVRGTAIGDKGDLYVLIDGAILDIAPSVDNSITLSASPNPVTMNSPLTITAVVANSGLDTSRDTVATVSLPAGLTNITFTPASPVCSLSTDNRVLTCALGDLDSGSAPVEITVNATSPSAPGALSAGSAVTTASIDTETSNDTANLSIDVPGSDLVLTAISEPPATQKRGTSFTLTFTEQNIGDAATTGSSITRFYLSSNGTSTTKLLAGTRTVSTLLNPNDTYTSTAVTVVIPGTTVAGTYYLLGCADDTKAIPERNEMNNCLASTTTINVTLL